LGDHAFVFYDPVILDKKVECGFGSVIQQLELPKGAGIDKIKVPAGLTFADQPVSLS